MNGGTGRSCTHGRGGTASASVMDLSFGNGSCRITQLLRVNLQLSSVQRRWHAAGHTSGAGGRRRQAEVMD